MVNRGGEGVVLVEPGAPGTTGELGLGPAGLGIGEPVPRGTAGAVELLCSVSLARSYIRRKTYQALQMVMVDDIRGRVTVYWPVKV